MFCADGGGIRHAAADQLFDLGMADQGDGSGGVENQDGVPRGQLQVAVDALEIGVAHGCACGTQVFSGGIEDLARQWRDPVPGDWAAGRAADFDFFLQEMGNGTFGRWFGAFFGRGGIAGVGGQAAVLPFDEEVVGLGQMDGALAQQSLKLVVVEGFDAGAGGQNAGDFGDSAFRLAEAACHVFFKSAGQAQQFGFGPLKGLFPVEADQGDGDADDQGGEQREGKPDGHAQTPQGRVGICGRFRRLGGEGRRGKESRRAAKSFHLLEAWGLKVRQAHPYEHR